MSNLENMLLAQRKYIYCCPIMSRKNISKFQTCDFDNLFSNAWFVYNSCLMWKLADYYTTAKKKTKTKTKTKKTHPRNKLKKKKKERIWKKKNTYIMVWVFLDNHRSALCSFWNFNRSWRTLSSVTLMINKIA